MNQKLAMKNPRLTIGESDLRTGYFYELMPLMVNEYPTVASFETIGKDWIRSTVRDEKTQWWGDIGGTHYKQVRWWKCGREEAHGLADFVLDIQVELYNREAPDEFAGFLPTTERTFVLEWLARRIEKTDLTGATFHPAVPVLQGEPLPAELKKRIGGLYQLICYTPPPMALCRFTPAEAERCAHCGNQLPYCLECGEISGGVCTKCGEVWVIGERELKKDTPLHLVVREEKGWSVPVFDIRRWNGDDFTGSDGNGWVTRRTVDFLLSIQAAPFLAKPVPVNVHGLSKAELEKLESTRRPVKPK